jgi:hypothetical protein
LRAVLAKRVAILMDKGMVDLEALPPPAPANKHVAIADAEEDDED